MNDKKLPNSVPDFLKNEGQNFTKTTEANTPKIPESKPSADEPPPLPTELTNPKVEKKTIPSSAQKNPSKEVPQVTKPESVQKQVKKQPEKTQEVTAVSDLELDSHPEMETPTEVVVSKPKKKRNFKETATQVFLSVVFLSLVGGLVHFYLQTEHWKGKAVAVDSKLINLTKQIVSLNLENNQLSGKVVNYQKELENNKQIETNSESMQENLMKMETERKEFEAKQNEMMQYIQELEKANDQLSKQTKKPALPKKNITPVKSSVVIPPVAPKAETPVVTPKPSDGETANPQPQQPATTQSPSPKAADQVKDYEIMMISQKQKSCAEKFKRDTLQKCHAVNKALDYELGSEIRPTDLNGQKVTKLVYKCSSPTQKTRYFKYGPLELFNTCK